MVDNMQKIIERIEKLIAKEEERISDSSYDRDKCIYGGRVYAYKEILDMLKPIKTTIVPKFKQGDNVVFMRRVEDQTFYYNGKIEAYTVIVDDTGTHIEYAIIDRCFSTEPQHREEDYTFATFEEAKAKNDALFANNKQY